MNKTDIKNEKIEEAEIEKLVRLTNEKATDDNIEISNNWVVLRLENDSKDNMGNLLSASSYTLTFLGFPRPILCTNKDFAFALFKADGKVGDLKIIETFLNCFQLGNTTEKFSLSFEEQKDSVVLSAEELHIGFVPKRIDTLTADAVKSITDRLAGNIYENFDTEEFLKSRDIKSNTFSFEDCTCYLIRDIAIPYSPCAVIKWDNERLAFFSKSKAFKDKNLDDFIIRCGLKKIKGILTPMDILERQEPEISYIKTGITGIDCSTNGLKRGGLSLVSGLRSSGKSSVLSQIALNAARDDIRTLIYSGELRASNLLTAILKQAVGAEYLEKSPFYDNSWTIPTDIKLCAARWINDKISIYDNQFSEVARNVLSSCEEAIKENNIELLILDNLMTLDLGSISPEKTDVNGNEAQTIFMQILKRIAETYNCHICLVAHPRKIPNGLIRLTDVAGTSNLGNLVDEAFIVHRVNQDFENSAGSTFGNKVKDLGGAGNIIEIAKDRDNGTMDKLVPLWYSEIDHRFLNYSGEVIQYPWQKYGGWEPSKQKKYNDIRSINITPVTNKSETKAYGYNGKSKKAAQAMTPASEGFVTVNESDADSIFENSDTANAEANGTRKIFKAEYTETDKDLLIITTEECAGSEYIDELTDKINNNFDGTAKLKNNEDCIGFRYSGTDVKAKELILNTLRPAKIAYNEFIKKYDIGDLLPWAVTAKDV